MKILAIRGKNLASLEEAFEIDFTSEPLKSAGIFAITGPTGAGKSTILDALCLALFDDAPRLNKAESSININDVEDKTITLKDSRNILRRGAGEAYAEVDFIALNGHKYRSRWMVRRARGKSDGALQSTSIKVDNLSTSTEEQGTKKDLLIRISEIIGLTFDQFTRAVLLAQGDFANFLKAKQNEKAELLEKLTGTEVYSKISVAIFQKANEARNALELLHIRIKDIKILTGEELEVTEQEKTNLGKEIVLLKIQASVIENQLNWIKQDELLKLENIQAEEALKAIHARMQEAAPRYEYMSMIDISMEIRDAYIELTNKSRQQEKLNTSLQTKEEEFKTVSERYNTILAELGFARKLLDETEQKYNALKPELAMARELDEKIRNLKEKLDETNKELVAYRKQLTTYEQNITNLKIEQQRTIQKKETLSKWFLDNEIYKNIILRIDLINALLGNAQSAKKQQANATSSLESGKSILATYNNQLKVYEDEAERLNRLLPTEILNLRSKLKEGVPCPVCGSTHHPLHDHTDQNDHVNEKELETAKKVTADAIAKTRDTIAKTKNGITEFEIHSHNFQSQYENAYKELKQYLQLLPHWESKFNEGLLQKELVTMVSQWNINKPQLDQCIAQLGNYTVRIEAEHTARTSVMENIHIKGESVKSINSSLSEYIGQRKQLTGNKSVEEVENQYSIRKQQLSNQYEQLRSAKDKVETEKASIAGSINQLKKDNETSSHQIESLHVAVQKWVNSNTHQITLGILKELMSKSREWINQEKEYLAAIKNQELVTKTTLSERNKRLATHQGLEDKPADSQTKELLFRQQAEITEKTEIINKRFTEIELLLLAHKNGSEQIKAFEKELDTKTESYNNWAKLNDLLGSATGNKFKTIAQGYTLDVLLGYANKHLEELTGRYKLEKISDTLALQVIDNDMLGEVRTVHSLSGGESFLISLALALGLSSLSSNRMKIESLFIDEGFGSLDIETLGIAMDALENLQTRGRKIGVISHVEEMKERITTQIQIVKTANGRSIIKIMA